MSNQSLPAPTFTEKQGQYLAVIYTYSLINERPPAEADMQRFFKVTPPNVHSMVVEREHKGFIKRTPRQARSIEILLVGRRGLKPHVIVQPDFVRVRST